LSVPMRVALCISGMPRSFKRCVDQLRRNFLDIYQPDIFISTWRSELRDETFPESDTAEELIELLQPKKFDIEIFNKARQESFETNPFKSFSDQAGRSVSRMIPMYYKVFLADTHRFIYERENKIQYDVVVRARSDLLFQAPVALEVVPPNVVAFPIKNSTSHVNDQFWYSSPETATQLAGLYYAIPDLWYSGVLIHGEALLYAYVVAKGMVIKPFEVNYEILR
jgi:hypothetical protein